MYVNMKYILDAANRDNYAVMAINCINMEMARAAIEAAEEEHSPIIVQFGVGQMAKMAHPTEMVPMIKAMAERASVPVCLNLDHGPSFEAEVDAIKWGFSNVMIDASSLPYEENVKRSRMVADMAHANGISVEAEVGAIGGTEDGITADGEVADPAECKKIVDCGIDFLAAGIGNIHGIYPENWSGLHFDALEKINQATNHIPLVLHGGTGIPDDQIVHAIKNGVSKINVNTDCQLVFAAATIEYVNAGLAAPTGDNKTKGYDPRKLLKPGYEAIRAKVEEKIKLFGSDNKA